MANESGSDIRKMGTIQEANGSCAQVRPMKAHELDALVGKEFEATAIMHETQLW